MVKSSPYVRGPAESVISVPAKESFQELKEIFKIINEKDNTFLASEMSVYKQ